MKLLKIVFTTVIFPLLLTSCEQKHNLTAELDGLKNDTIFVEYATVPNYFIGNSPNRDTIYAQNGKFVYDIPSKESYFVGFYPKQSQFTRLSGEPFRANQNYIVTLIEPNDNIQVSGKLNEYYASYDARGSAFNEEYSELRKSYIEKSSKGAELELKIDSLSANNSSSEKINKLFQERNSFNRLSTKAELNYIENNPRKNISAFFLTKQNPETFEKYYSNLPIEVKSGIFRVGLDAKMERIKKSKKIDEARSEIVEGVSAPNFKLLSVTGEKVELFSIRDKYIVLDFWGSWCPPCIKGFPKMKEYYSRYKNDVEFIGIACNDTEKKWKETVNNFDLKWVQLINSDAVVEKDISVKYGIKNYPTKIILNKKKIIVGIFMGESEEFYAALNDLLQ
ncbi:thiol-disulfide isomerase/thioredoxin [Leeuwenhoekiella aestuarii]|uniref:Thiol-disulfide isomerase/thioredoxin n=1 Tax=Leeuwenhoekiella aestuarii TaxID=2249426 RepID=A0A4Q0P0B9_9FLAO|nr:thioredoxin-like domain-containing protein [Leeuwenhoekiella aestuarii]RXG18315.1 thiol-disulfide isomerase/thioredoxin [Leeuwenhoekiella aestuarii]RXG19620.1 thiol-disulfide isomerase/thioredoxin [Leeuwenhoekiella aestuarii]